MTTIHTIDPNAIPQAKLHAYLLAAVAPRPICFASTIDKAGNVNLSPFSFFNVFSSNPPILIFSPARRGRDNTTKHTHQNILEVPEVVINIVNHPMVEQMSLASTEYDKGVNEFLKAGFTQVPAEKVSPPRVGEAPVAFECIVDQVVELGTGGGAGNLMVARVVLIHIQSKYLDQHGDLDTQKLDLVARMGGNWYCHANGSALFEIPKPLHTKGMGVDQLPPSVRNSAVLTGNDLGRLGNIAQLPSPEYIQEVLAEEAVKTIFETCPNQSDKLEKEIHQLAKQVLQEGNTEKALAVLMTIL